jgi:glycerophosphoryl diester phosphodiesterase
MTACALRGDAAVQSSNPIAALATGDRWTNVSPEPYQWTRDNTMIAHGMGGIDDRSVTNSLEAMQRNYRLGYRLFEVDLILTADGMLVARHDWKPSGYERLGQPYNETDPVLSRDEFKSLPIHGRWTPLAFEDVVAIMKAYPDVHVIADMKVRDPGEMTLATKAIVHALDMHGALESRMIIQVQGEQMLDRVRAVNDFENIIYDLGGGEEGAVAIARQNGIRVVAFPERMWSPELAAELNGAGLIGAIYTVNDSDSAKEYLASGVDLVYSDFLRP